MPQLDLDVHGLSIRVDIPMERFAEFVSRNYSQFRDAEGQEPSISVEFSSTAGRRAERRKAALRHFGQGIYVGDREVYWENEFGFRVSVIVDDDGDLMVQSFHEDLIGKRGREEREKDFQRSMRWAIHFPVFNLLQYERGWSLLHASAVAKDGDVIAFCGTNKVGKSTLAVHMAREHGFDLMTDNFLFLGDGEVHAFPEVIRLTPEAAQRLGITPERDGLVYGKHHIDPETVGVTLAGTPKAFFILNGANDLMTTTLKPSVAWTTMGYLHSILGEFPQHSYFSVWPLVVNETMPVEQAHRTAKAAPWYELSHELDWDLQGVAEEVCRCI